MSQLLARYKPLVTTDRHIALDHAMAIPAANPGNVIISNEPDVRTMTAAIAQKILAMFKANFPERHSVSWRNSIVTISNRAIEVSHARSGSLVPDLFAQITEPDWQIRLKTVLEQNDHSRRWSA